MQGQLKLISPAMVKARILEYARPAVRFFRPAPIDHLKPVSRRWGYERGTAVGRWYIDRYMEEKRKDVTGVVLEIKNNRYTKSVGSNVTHSDILDVDTKNKNANIYADLAKADCVPSDTYDCFIVTEVLQFVYDLHSAIQHCWRVLKPGGVLLVSVPNIAPQDAELAEVDHWRFTKKGCERLFGDVFGPENVEVTGYGNFATSVSGLSGIAVEELPSEKLEHHDSTFTQGLFIRAQKGAA